MRPLLGILTVLTLAGAIQPAAAYDYPWCAYYSGRTGGENCGFVSFEQCRWTVSGAGGFCAQNPFYAAAQSTARPRPKKQRKPRHD